MLQCIFCLQEKDRLTDEHVFPAALGGVSICAESVCAECNHGFSAFEQPLAEELTPLRLLLQIPDRRGNIPEATAVVKTAGNEYEARVKSDGSLRLKPIITEVERAGGVREFLHQFATERQKEKLRQQARDKRIELIEYGPGNPEEAEVHIGGELEFIGSVGALRMASKIAYVGLAERAGVNVATSDSFNDVRTYVQEGAGKARSRLFINERFLQAVQQGPHQHSLILAARHDKVRVDAIVRLFGGLCYFVQLSDHYFGADFSYTLVNDAQCGELNPVLQSHVDAEMMETEDVATSADTQWDNLPAWGERFVKFLDTEIQSKLERDRAQAV